MSIKNLASIIGALGVGMSGYAKGRAQFQDNERQKVLAQRDDKQFERTQAEWGRQDAARNAVKDGYADVQPEPVVGGGIPEEQAVVGYKANGQTYGDLSGAQQSLIGMNSSASRAKRAADNLAKLGETDLAEKYEARMKTLIKEGTVEALDGVQRGRSAPEVVEKNGGMVVRPIGKEIADRFNSTGTMKVSADMMIQDFLTTDASGRKVVNSRVIGKDGAPVVDDVQAAYRTMLTAKERFELEDKEGQRFQQGQQIAETSRAHQATEGLTRARDAEAAKQNQRQNNIAQQGIAMQGRRVRLEENSLKSQTVDGKLAAIEKTLGKLSPEKRQQYAETLYGLSKGKSAESTKMLDDMTQTFNEKFQDNNPTATPKQVATETAKYRKQQEQEFAAARQDAATDESMKESLGGINPGSAEYKKQWAAAKQMGFTDQQLVARGYALPNAAKTVPNPMQRTVAEVGAGQRAPSAPAERIWIGNKYEVNPAYVEWDKRYGAAQRKQQQSENARLVSAYDRAKL